MLEIDDPNQIPLIRELIKKKGFLNLYYREMYKHYIECIKRSPSEGLLVELGSGGGFSKDIIPEIITSEVFAANGIDKIADATRMPFSDLSIRTLFLLNVFHHIPDVALFFSEAIRCLVPGGRVLIIDPYPGFFSTPLLKWVHHEGFDPDATEWKFASNGPLSSANNALAWIVFERDRKQFETLFPQLRIDFFNKHSPLRYWLSGGLKRWSVAPKSMFGLASLVDQSLVRISSRFGSFATIELIKTT